MSEPCKLCGVRPDVACRHRPADTSWSMGDAPPDEDGRAAGNRPGNGHHLKGVRAANLRLKMRDAGY